jgi:RNA ligase (TIGR02306 family)
MSEFKVCFTPVRSLSQHPNPEVLRLEIAEIYGFQVVVKKGQYQVGDFVCYCPIDSVLPSDLEKILFSPDAKIKLNKSRIKQIRIQKFPSQGMLIDVQALRDLLKLRGLKAEMEFKLEHNYMELFSISKYEPPVPHFQVAGEKKARKVNNNNPLLHSYNGLDNLRWFPDRFTEGEEVVIQEKLHGTNARAGLLPTQANTIWKKIKKFFGKLPEYEFCYGSNNVELTNRASNQNYYGEDIYAAALKKACYIEVAYNIKADRSKIEGTEIYQYVSAAQQIKPMEVIYGEIIGEGIQKNYDYGLKEKKFVLFDVKIMQLDGSFTWLNPEEVEQYAKERGFDFVPVLHVGPFNKQLATELSVGDSVYCNKQKVREGVVVKSRLCYNDPSCSSKKKALKIISTVYLDKEQTDFH